MLEMRTIREACSTELSPTDSDALICFYERTICSDCAESKLNHTSPNYGGNKAVEQVTDPHE